MKLFFALLALLVLAGVPLACSSDNPNPSTPNPIPTSTPVGSPTSTATNSPTPTPTNTPTSTATNSPTPTPTNTPAPVGVTFSVVNPGVGVYRYSTTGTGGVSVTAPITISVGTSAVWDNSNGGIHPLYFDDSSSCVITGQGTGFPITQVLSVGTYHFHCGNHGSCVPLNSSCPPTSCAAMAVTLVVQ